MRCDDDDDDDDVARDAMQCISSHTHHPKQKNQTNGLGGLHNKSSCNIVLPHLVTT